MAVGLCDYCGVTCPQRRVCELCNAAFSPMMTEVERKAKVLMTLLLPETEGRWLPRFLVERTGFQWFRELPGQVQMAADNNRSFAYVDEAMLAGMRARLQPPVPDSLAVRDADGRAIGPCPRCGVNNAWWQVETRRVEQQLVHGQVIDVDMPELRWKCQACRLVPRDLDDHVARLLGLRPNAEALRLMGEWGYRTWPGGREPSLAAELGATWFARSGLTEPQSRPFAWWPSLAELAARAYERYPDQSYWTAMSAYERAKELATRREEVAGHVQGQAS